MTPDEMQFLGVSLCVLGVLFLTATQVLISFWKRQTKQTMFRDQNMEDSEL